MNVGLAIEVDRSVSHLMPAVRAVNEVLKSFFMERQYGADLIYTAIGVILVDDSATAQNLHSIRPFCYKNLDQVRHPGTGHVMTFHNSASWDVKPNFAVFSGQDLEGARNFLCEALIASTNVLELNCDQYPDFDVARFLADFEACLRAHCQQHLA